MGNRQDDGGGPAFPRLKVLEGTGKFSDGAWDAFAAYGEKGMSYHDVAALMAMQGMNADPSIGERVAAVARSHNISGLDVIARWAHNQADAMLAERERRRNNEQKQD